MSELAKTLESYVSRHALQPKAAGERPSSAPAEQASLDLENPAALRQALANMELLRALGVEILDAVVARCPLRTLHAGEPLLVAGQINSEIFLVLSGEFAVYLDERLESRVATLRVGDTVGEL